MTPNTTVLKYSSVLDEPKCQIHSAEVLPTCWAGLIMKLMAAFTVVVLHLNSFNSSSSRKEVIDCNN